MPKASVRETKRTHNCASDVTNTSYAWMGVRLAFTGDLHTRLPICRAAGILLHFRLSGWGASSGECAPPCQARFCRGYARRDAPRIAGRQRRAWPVVPSRRRTRSGAAVPPIPGILATAVLLLLNVLIHHLRTSVPVAQLPRTPGRNHAAHADHTRRRPQQHPSRFRPSRYARWHHALRPRSLLPAALRRRVRAAAFVKQHDERALPVRGTHCTAHGVTQSRCTIADGRECACCGARGYAPGGRWAAHAAACGAHRAQRCKRGRHWCGRGRVERTSTLFLEPASTAWR